eukprot:COSAG06_NODE_46229_length_348_cov_1.044177_1_plen_82_part_10
MHPSSICLLENGRPHCAVATDERSCCRIPRPDRSSSNSSSSNGSAEATSDADSDNGTGAGSAAVFDAAVGRYVYLEIEGVEY